MNMMIRLSQTQWSLSQTQITVLSCLTHRHSAHTVTYRVGVCTCYTTYAPVPQGFVSLSMPSLGVVTARSTALLINDEATLRWGAEGASFACRSDLVAG